MKDTKKIEQAASLEELFERLDRVIGGLEGEELSLEDSFNLYQEGMELVKCCNRTISDVAVSYTHLDVYKRQQVYGMAVWEMPG